MKRQELATAIGISESMLSRLVKRGMPTTTVQAAERWRKRHLIPAMVKGQRAGTEKDAAPIGHVSNSAPDPAPASSPPDLVGEPAADDSNKRPVFDTGYTTARARREFADAETAEINLKKLRGEVLLRTDVDRAGFEVGRELRDAMESTVNPLAAEIAPLNTADACADVLRRHNRALQDLLVKAFRTKVGLVIANHANDSALMPEHARSVRPEGRGIECASSLA